MITTKFKEPSVRELRGTTAALEMGARVIVPTREHYRQTGNTGPLMRGNPIVRAWEPNRLGWPTDQVYVITGVAVLRDETWAIDNFGLTQHTTTKTRMVYRARRTSTSREIFINPQHAKEVTK